MSDQVLPLELMRFILVQLPVCDVINCAMISKQWKAACEDDIMWLHKYMISSDINSDKIKWDIRPNGYYRKMFLNRFGRDSKLFILYNNYKNTNNVKYLKQFNKLAESTWVTFHPVHKVSLADNLIFVDKISTQASVYIGIYPTNYNALSGSKCSWYSQENLECVQIGFEIVECADLDDGWRLINVVALLQGATTPEHLCVYICHDLHYLFHELDATGADEFEKMDSLRKYVSLNNGTVIEPMEDVCRKILKVIGSKMTPRELIMNIGNVAVRHCNSPIPSSLSSLSTSPLDTMMKFHQRIVEEKKEAAMLTKLDEKDRILGFHYSREPPATSLDGSYYFDLMYRSAGELQKNKVINVANELGLKPQIMDLLRNTTFVGYRSRYGKFKPELYGRVNYNFHQISSASICDFVLSPPQRPPIHMSSGIRCNSTSISNDTDLSLKIESEKIIEQSGGKLYFSESRSMEVLQQLKSSSSLTPVDFFKDMLKDIKSSRKNWWHLESWHGVTLETNIQNEPRIKKLRELRTEANNMHKQVKWDGRPHSSFKSWIFVEDNDYDDDFKKGDRDNGIINDNNISVMVNENGSESNSKTGKRKRDSF